MKVTAKLFGGLVVGAFAFLFALAGPGVGSADAYVNYADYTSNYTSYVKYNSYTPSNYVYKSYTPGNYTNYTNYQKPTNNVPAQPTPTQPPQPSQPTNPSTNPSSGVDKADEQAMLNLVNKERVAAGLQPLAYDAKLTQLAEMKAKDMIDNNYFGHTSPTYGSPFDMMKNNGVTYSYAGENLAGAPDVNTAHTNLMNSPGHRANILKPEYTKVGIGVVDGGPYGKMYVQEFTG